MQAEFLFKQQRDVNKDPIRFSVIGTGKLGSMFLEQTSWLTGLHIGGIVNLNPANAISNLAYVGKP